MPADLAVAAFQKEIRRGGKRSENALKLCYELQTTSAGAEDKMWQRILIIAAEDVGAGDPQMVSNVWALHEMAKTYKREEGDRLLFPMHAVRLLCMAHKDRATDDAKAWMKGIDGAGGWDEIKPTVPDYAYDKHTSQGQAMGRGDRHFLTEATKLIPESPDRDRTYLNRILAGLPNEGDVITRDGKTLGAKE